MKNINKESDKYSEEEVKFLVKAIIISGIITICGMTFLALLIKLIF